MKKKALMGAVTLAAAALVGIGAMMSANVPADEKRPTQIQPEARNPDRIQAPPRPARATPVERLITAEPR